MIKCILIDLPNVCFPFAIPELTDADSIFPILIFLPQLRHGAVCWAAATAARRSMEGCWAH